MKTIPALLLLLIASINLNAQHVEFSHLDNSNGLSNNQIESIFRDSRGFMWFGTNSGINRYDGSKFKSYKHDKNDPLSSPFDRYTSIQEDANGNLWMQSNGITYVMYDYRTERFIENIDSIFTEMGLPTSPSMMEIDATNKHMYLYHPQKGLYEYNPESKTITKYAQYENLKQTKQGELTKIKPQGNFIWLLHENGLIERLNRTSKAIEISENFFKGKISRASIKKTLFVDSNNDLWVYPGIDDKGVVYLDSRKRTWTMLDNSLSSTFVRCVAQDQEGRIWIGTDHGGINLYDKKAKKISALKNNRYNSNSISQNSIISIFCDKDNIIWVGTYKNGVSYYHPRMFKFKKSPLFHHFNKDSDIFDCNSLLIDSQDNLWIGTNGRGLIRYKSQSDEIKVFQNNEKDKNSLSSNIITSILEDHSKTLWIGTFLGGLNAFDGKSFTRYQIKENDINSISSKSIYGLVEDQKHNLWIGTLGGGVDQLSADRNTFSKNNIANTPELFSNYILSMTSDDMDNIYLSTDQGINLIDRHSKQISHYFNKEEQQDSLASISSNYTFIDSRNLYWIATDKGINIYNPRTQHFSYITYKDGLPSDEVVSLIEDNDGNVWAGTRNGLACIYCEYVDHILTFRIAFFDTKDGLPSSVCNQNAIYKDKDGLIYVGCTKGYVSFDPKNIVFDTEVPSPKFSELIISNQVIVPNVEYNGRVILKKTINDLDEITLNYKETNFTVQFSALNYIHPDRSRYRYMLEGLDSEWTEIQSGNIGAASFSNLNSGRYELIVYASNGDNVWTKEPLVLKIKVNPPFWLSWWAVLIYILAIAFILRCFMKYKLNKQRYEFEQAQKIMEANKTHEVDELKLRFFTNISHEFKTPLTLILTPLEKLLKSPTDDEQKSMLTIMYKNATNLLGMVNEILDFRKFDLNKMALNISRGDIIYFIKDITQSFSALASEKDIKLTFTSYMEELQMEFDKEKMHKIIANLISNAFKYTEEGQIDISVGVSEIIQNKESFVRQLNIKITDTGIGIEDEYKEKIFERFFRIEHTSGNTSSGTGIGLHLVSEYIKLHHGEISVDSIAGKGSTFIVTIPMQNSSYKELKNQDIIHSGNKNIEEETLIVATEKTPSKKQHLPVLLAVDDNEDFCEFITNLFNNDYRIIIANDGVEAYSTVLDQLPDIILCDVMMPKMDGYEFCRKIKEDIRTSHIPIILLTAKSSDENKYSGIEAGADDYIAKPFNIDILKLKMSKIIEKQKNLQNSFKKKIDISPSEIEITSLDEKFVKKAVALVEENIGNSDFLVEDLCKKMGMSRVYFYKKILALTDKSPSEFIRFIRLKRGAHFLEKSQLFVNEIAFRVGFNDPKYFRKYFKEEFGVTPNEYKKNTTK